MTRLLSFVFAAALVLTAASSATAQDKIDLTGTWDFKIDVAGTAGTPTFVFKQEGDKLTGKYKGQFGEADLTGKVEGKNIEFSFEGMGQKVTYKGTIEDKDNVKGEANYGEVGTGTWTGKRQPAKPM